jgi:hypothetical protein
MEINQAQVVKDKLPAFDAILSVDVVPRERHGALGGYLEEANRSALHQHTVQTHLQSLRDFGRGVVIDEKVNGPFPNEWKTGSQNPTNPL